MNNYINNACFFIAGIGLGMVATRKSYKKHYEDRLYSETMSIRNAFKEKDEMNDISQKLEEEDDNSEINKEKPKTTMYYTYSDTVVEPEKDLILHRNDMTVNITDMSKIEHPSEDTTDAYFVDVDSFLENNQYAKKELVYYMDDGVLIDSDENAVNILDTVSELCMHEFYEITDMVCYIRNDNLREDYEITKALGSYCNIMNEEDY